MKLLQITLVAVLFAGSSAVSAVGWSGPGYYVWAPSSTGWDSTKVIWTDRFDSYEKCLPVAEALNQQLDPDRASAALFLFECHQLDQEVRAITAPEVANIHRDIGKR